MKLIRPFKITDAALTASNVALSEPAYDAGTTYGEEAIVRGSAPGNEARLFLSLQAGNVGKPLSDPAWWVEMGPANRWAMFDESNTTQTKNPGLVEVTVQTTGRVDAVALLNIAGASVRVRMTDVDEGIVYDRTFSLVSDSGIVDWWSYFFEPIARSGDLVVTDLPPYANAAITVSIIDEAGEVRVGNMVLGLTKILGDTEMGATVGIQDYSRKDQNQFGDFIIVQRAYSKRASFNVWIPRGSTDEVQRLLASYRAAPIVYVGSQEFGATVVYGFYRDFSIAISYPTHSICSLDIVGLT